MKKYLQNFFRWFCHPDFLEDIEGDLNERHKERLANHSKAWANWLFFVDVCSLLRPGIIRSNIFYNPFNHTPVIQQNLMNIIRSFNRHKTSFWINVVSLSIGLACVLLIFLWVLDELNVDRFHAKGDRLYHVMEIWEYPDRTELSAHTQGPLADAMEAKLPEVEMATPIISWAEFTISQAAQDLRTTGYYVGSNFFEALSFKLAVGAPEQVLSAPDQIVLSQSLAIDLFGSADEAIGQSVKINQKELFSVSGVFEDIPNSSTLQFDLLLSFEKFKQDPANRWVLSWTNHGPTTLVVLQEDANPDVVAQKLNEYYERDINKQKITFSLLPFPDRYLYSRTENGKIVGGRIEYVRLFSLIGLFILLIACINFMNLSTARATNQAKAIGIKKTVGATRGILVQQYLSESVFLASFAMLSALVIVHYALPSFNSLTEKDIQLRFTPYLIGILFCITILTGLLAGSYPALYLSAFRPAQVLKGQLKTSVAEFMTRRGLVVLQFSIAMILVVGVLTVYQQVQFIQSKSLGYQKDQLIYFDMEGALKKQYNSFEEEIKNLPEISAISRGQNFINNGSGTIEVAWPGHNPDDVILFHSFFVDFDYIETLGLELIKGRSFSDQFGDEAGKIIINEKAAQIMGFDDPIGQQMNLWGQLDAEIVGVVRDFHFESMHTGIAPSFFLIVPEQARKIYIRLKANSEQSALTKIKALYGKVNPGFPFEYRYVDQDYAALYAAERRVANLSKLFAGLAIFISCLGLFGLSTFTADRRKKEFGIRKVLGASVSNIMFLLSKEFLQLVGISIVVGTPIAYWLVNNWLQQFEYRPELNLWFFLLAGLLILCIAMTTVAAQAFRSAIANPQESLQEE